MERSASCAVYFCKSSCQTPPGGLIPACKPIVVMRDAPIINAFRFSPNWCLSLLRKFLFNRECKAVIWSLDRKFMDLTASILCTVEEMSFTLNTTRKSAKTNEITDVFFLSVIFTDGYNSVSNVVGLYRQTFAVGSNYRPHYSVGIYRLHYRRNL